MWLHHLILYVLAPTYNLSAVRQARRWAHAVGKAGMALACLAQWVVTMKMPLESRRIVSSK